MEEREGGEGKGRGRGSRGESGEREGRERGKKTREYRNSANIVSGFSTNNFMRLEKLAMVAPSITRWSADQLTF